MSKLRDTAKTMLRGQQHIKYQKRKKKMKETKKEEINQDKGQK